MRSRSWFPMLRGAAFEELRADIQKNGLREPILLDAEGRPLGRPRKSLANLQEFSGGPAFRRHGCEELIAAVESGALAVSPVGVLAGLPEEVALTTT